MKKLSFLLSPPSSISFSNETLNEIRSFEETGGRIPIVICPLCFCVNHAMKTGLEKIVCKGCSKTFFSY